MNKQKYIDKLMLEIKPLMSSEEYKKYMKDVKRFVTLSYIDAIKLNQKVRLDIIEYLNEKRNEVNQEKYKKAYDLFCNSWDSFSKENQSALNKELNNIFGKGHPEYVEE